jgi:hypothetical protein
MSLRVLVKFTSGGTADRSVLEAVCWATAARQVNMLATRRTER